MSSRSLSPARKGSVVTARGATPWQDVSSDASQRQEQGDGAGGSVGVGNEGWAHCVVDRPGVVDLEKAAEALKVRVYMHKFTEVACARACACACVCKCACVCACACMCVCVCVCVCARVFVHACVREWRAGW